MKSLLRLTAALTLFAAVSAHAAGINLRWNSCAGPSVRTFACNTNSGTDYLFSSWVAPPGITAPIEYDLVMDFQSLSPTMPSWWDFTGASSCRGSWLTISGDGSTDVSGMCTDFWEGQGYGAILSYTAQQPNTRRLTALVGMPVAINMIDAGVEYFAARLGISHAATVGTSCSGCTTPLCIVLQSIRIVQPVGLGDVLLTAPAQNNCVTWQGGVPTCCAVPAPNRTWGAVKALYR